MYLNSLLPDMVRYGTS